MLEVRRLRQAREWNQTELAYHAGLAPSVISQIENGKRDPSARTLRKLAEALGVDVADLFPKAQARLPLDAWRPPDALGLERRDLTPERRDLALQRDELRGRRTLRFEAMYHADDATRREALRSATAEELEAYIAELASIRDRREGEIAEAETSPLQLFRYARRLGLLQGEAESYAAASGALVQGGDRTA